MSTHNIGFYEDLTKFIFELSSNIIKYAPFFFCWKTLIRLNLNRVSKSVNVCNFRTNHSIAQFSDTLAITQII